MTTGPGGVAVVRLLFVCTANQCRSPMAVAILRAKLAAAGIEGVEAASAGLLPGGAPATAEAAATVPGLDDHVSRRLTPEMVAAADIVVGMTRAHVREVAVCDRDAFARAFTLKELVRRGEEAGPRRPGEPVAAWVARVGAGRSPLELLGASPDDDIDDPIGRSQAAYRRTAEELDVLLDRLVGLMWPEAWGR
jgi:protein-tyrosine phosphatase